MNITRIWIAGGALAIAAVLAGGWLLGVQPLLAVAEENAAQQASVEVLVAAQEAQLADLKAQAERRGELESEVAVLREAVPAEAAMPELVGELGELADQAGVRITSFGTSDAVPLPVAPAAGDAAAAPAAVGPVAIPVQVAAEGEADALIDFVRRLQQADRLLLPAGVSLALPVQAEDRRVSLSLLAYASPAAVPAAETPAA